MPAEIFTGASSIEVWHDEWKPKPEGWDWLSDLTSETIGFDFGIRRIVPSITLPSGDVITMDDYRAIVREPVAGLDDEYRVFGVLSKDFVPLLNSELIDAINPLTSRDRYPVVAAGLLGRPGTKKAGSTFFASLDMGEWTPEGCGEEEKHKSYMVILNDNTGGTAALVKVVDFAVICHNTYMAARNAKSNYAYKIAHVGDPAGLLRMRVEMEAAALDRRIYNRKFVEAMIKFPVSRESRNGFWEVCFPDPTLPERVRENVEATYWFKELPKDNSAFKASYLRSISNEKPDKRERELELTRNSHYGFLRGIERAKADRMAAAQNYLEIAESREACQNTMYGAYNAATYVSDHRKGQASEDLAYSIFAGSRMEEKYGFFAGVEDLMGAALPQLPKTSKR